MSQGVHSAAMFKVSYHGYLGEDRRGGGRGEERRRERGEREKGGGEKRKEAAFN